MADDGVSRPRRRNNNSESVLDSLNLGKLPHVSSSKTATSCYLLTPQNEQELGQVVALFRQVLNLQDPSELARGGMREGRDYRAFRTLVLCRGTGTKVCMSLAQSNPGPPACRTRLSVSAMLCRLRSSLRRACDPTNMTSRAFPSVVSRYLPWHWAQGWGKS